MRLRRTIVVVGGGFSGTLTAYHLLRRKVRARVVLVDPSFDLGLGLAYSTQSHQHLLNVPAGKISALPDQPDHLLRWLRKNYDAQVKETDFIPRAVFGRYIQSILEPMLPLLEHRQTTVLDCNVRGGQAAVRLADGTEILADAVVLATGNFNPAPLRGVDEQAIAAGVYCHSAWKNETYAELSPEAPVALIGSGLTAVDVLLRLRELGHRGAVTAISRHGVFPYRHAGYQALDGPVIRNTPKRASELLHVVHRAIRSGADWRAVVDSLRSRTNELWLALPFVEQQRFRRHLQRRWEVVRHRMAPAIADRIDAELKEGTLLQRRGSLHAVHVSSEGARVQMRDSKGELQEISAARVINCTGPDMNYTRVASPLLNSLFAQGQAVAGPHGYGLWADEAGALRQRSGAFSPILFCVGPPRQGTLIESIAVPELRQQAADLATILAERFSVHQQTDSIEAVDQPSVPTGEVAGNYELAS
ncbi:FAD/NAD(P)-binding protein [Edaphobacter albus]|uniref:FAD/NAD(P)-binding protein n=1 Tax=Edaphobacter sp. 4G125 TaxID=2763071 RepID=UPI001648722C|nr:FAD/NAD(P)-binding protein [Edaphobacter sp. 4G125]QNI36600.1 FAD/NAD(P)-binding protein [Edaphobacter sp. 4G125]